MTPLGEIAPERICDVWKGGRYRLDAGLIRQNLHDHPLFHKEASLGEDDAFVAVKRSAAALYDGPDPKTAHLSLLGGNPSLLSPLLRRAVEILRTEGFESLAVGQDSGHFLPGAPVDLDWMAPFLESHEFAAGGLSNDLEHDLSRAAPSSSNHKPQATSHVFRRLLPGDEASLDAFLAREFPGRWRFDVARKVEAEGVGTVFGLFVEGLCEGFALLQRDGCRMPIGGAVWRNDLGPGWGSLGPIGISKAVRGRGLGNALLAHALEDLRKDGARRTIIDWTGLVEFYGAHGFEVTRRYCAYRLIF